MKLTKKIIAMILTLSMFVSMSVFALEFPDVANDDANEEAINVLSSLGIIKGYEDGTFMPDKQVTRAELTSLLMRLMNLSITGITVTDSGYTDVATNHWAVYDIKTASNMGIIKGFGDGTFGPEESVTFEQAVKMVVAMLGYENLAIGKGGWPNGYVMQGRELGLLNKAEMTQTEPAPRKIIAQILYNALDVDLMDKTATSTPENISYEILYGKNVMTQYMKIEKIQGVVTQNPYTTLTATASSVLSDEIQIQTSTFTENYKVGTYTDAFDLLGLNVVAYVKYDDNYIYKEIKHIDTMGDVKEVVIPAEEIVSFTSSKVQGEQKDTGKMYSYTVDASSMKILYNGKYIDTSYAYTNNLLTPEIGTVTLIDSGAGFNLVKVESYNNYVVKTVDTSSKKIYVDTTLSNGVTTIDVPTDDVFEYNITIKKNGNDIKLSSISKGNIISVKENKSVQVGIKNLEILVSDSKLTGKITGEDGDGGYLIGSNYYKVSPSLDNTAAALVIKNKITQNANGTFYLDVFGNIAYAEFSAGATYNYGYIVKARTNTVGGEYQGIIKLYDYSSKAFKSFYFADKIVIDGYNYTDHSVAVSNLGTTADLLNARGGVSSNDETAQPIKYILNSAGEVSEINTVYDNGDDSLFVPGVYDADAKYTSTNRTFATDSGTVNIDTKTIIFSVPNNRSEESKYSIKTYSYFINTGLYDIEVVETTSAGIASTIILYESNQDEDVHYKSPMIVVSEIKDIYEDGENKTKLTGYVLNSGASAEYYVENRADLQGIGINSADVEKGDIIRFGLNSEGEINNNVYLYLDVSEAASGNHPMPLATYSKNSAMNKANYPMRRISLLADISSSYPTIDLDITGNFMNRYSFVYGTPLKTVTEDTNTLLFTDLLYNETGFNGVDTTQAVSLIIPSSTVFYTYDATQNDTNKLKVTKGETDTKVLEINTYDEVSTDCDNVYIYAVDGSVKAVVIIK